MAEKGKGNNHEWLRQIQGIDGLYEDQDKKNRVVASANGSRRG
jgi:hypothetical protein